MTTSKPISDGHKRRQSIPAYLLLGFIHLYCIFLSPVTRLFVQCRYHPTCSRYGLDAIQKYGALKGGAMTVRRILRCNPFFSGGYDPVK